MSISLPTQTVLDIGAIHITGNVIPANWWRHIVLPSGRPDSTAIVLLSDIVYWYRPSEIRNESTGALTGYRKRFHGDKLQRGYQAFADQFGFSKRETTDALKRLRDAGIIELELRTITTSEGMVMNNVLYISPVPSSIQAITNGTPPTLKRNSPYVETEDLLRSDVTPPTLKRDTNTEITTEITTEIKNNTGEAADAPPPKRVSEQGYSEEFEEAWRNYPAREGGNNKQAAWKAWKARLKQGYQAADMIAGVQRYAAHLSATGSAGTRYVKQASTFFGPDCHFAEEWHIAEKQPEPQSRPYAYQDTESSEIFLNLDAMRSDQGNRWRQ